MPGGHQSIWSKARIFSAVKRVGVAVAIALVRIGVGAFSGALAVAAILGSAGQAFASDPYEWRTIDGTWNNTTQQFWGSTNVPLERGMAPAYGSDGWSPSGADRPNARTISNTIFAQSGSIKNTFGLTDFVWQWGQFIDHDIDLTPDSSGEAFNITVPNGDPVFPDGSTIPLTRSKYDPGTGTDGSNPRQQMNVITSFIDGSNIYGSDAGRESWLRSTDATKPGQLKVSSSAFGDLLPFNDGTQSNANAVGAPATSLFVSGDIRANEQTGLASMHTLFMREHNRWAEAFSSVDPSLTSDEVFERARRVVGAEMQVVTYKEFLPALLGSQALGEYTGYDPNTDPTITNEFSTALYRFGHSMLSTDIKRLGPDGLPIAEGSLSLADAFFNPSRITDEGGIDPVLRGLASQVMQNVDAKVVDDVRNMLFGPPGAGGMDLAALNIQRGRDHGLCDYNSARVELGLSPVSSFDQITSDTELASAMRAVYGQTAGQDNVSLLDLWVGALSEDHMPGSSVGQMLSIGLRTQFDALRMGDRFYYENDTDLSSLLAGLGWSIDDLENRTLSQIIMDNTDITGLRADVFRIPGPGAGAMLAMVGLIGVRRRRSAAQAN